MSLSCLAATITAPANQGAYGLYQALVTWLTANPGVIIIDVDTFRYESQYEADEQRLRVIYEVSSAITGGWQARFYQNSLTTAGASAQEQFNSDMQAGATFVPWFVIDLTKYKNGRATSDTLLVLGVNTATDPFGTNAKNAWIGEPQADIAAGASGSCRIYDGAGTLLGTKTVKNVGFDTWVQYQRSYVVLDQESGLLIAIATCDAPAAAFTPPARTTTTPFPCPTYYPQTTPNTSAIA